MIETIVMQMTITGWIYAATHVTLFALSQYLHPGKRHDVDFSPAMEYD